MRRTFAATVLPLLLAAAGATAVLQTGSVPLGLCDVWTALAAAPPGALERLVAEARLAGALTAWLSGAALSVAGLAMQTLFRNPLADPSLLGVNSGAALGVAVTMLALGGTLTAGTLTLSGFGLTVAAALAGAVAVIALLAFCSVLTPSRLALLVAGVMISFGVGAFTSLLGFLAPAEGVQSYVVWGLGGFGGVRLALLPAYAAVLAAPAGFVALRAQRLDALLLGDDYARNLGVAVRRERTLLLLCCGLIAAAVTAACGPVSFVGLAVPHVARFALGAGRHKPLLAATMLWGGAVAVGCHELTLLPLAGGMLPLGVVTPLVGAPAVLWAVLSRSRRGRF